MNMEGLEKSLKTNFVGAANQLAQLFTHSVSYQKQAYVHGYNKSIKEVMEWLIKENQHPISVDSLMEFLRSRIQEPNVPVETSKQEDTNSNSNNNSVPPSPHVFPQGPSPTVFPQSYHNLPGDQLNVGSGNNSSKPTPLGIPESFELRNSNSAATFNFSASETAVPVIVSSTANPANVAVPLSNSNHFAYLQTASNVSSPTSFPLSEKKTKLGSGIKHGLFLL